MSNQNSFRISRRQFIRGSAASVALFHILPGRTLAEVNRLSPNQKVNVAGIGIGSQGGNDIDAVAREGHNIVALCDVDENYAAKKFAQYPKAKRFKDFRVMFDQMGKEIDAVVIGTPDHSHAVIAMEAMRRHKHVYCEKPLAHSVHEVRTLMDGARKYNVVTQLGNQGHSSDSIRRLCEWVWAGAIGQVHTVNVGCDSFPEVYCQTRNLDKLKQHYDVPKGLDYELWNGPVSFQPYTPFWVPWNWRGWMHYGNGAIGDWFCHVVDPSFWALELDAPASILAEVEDCDTARQGLTYPSATKITFEFPARNGRGPVKLVWYDGKNNPVPRPAEFSKDDKIPACGAVLLGEKGMIVHGSHGGAGCYLTPEKLMDAYTGKNAPTEKISRVKNHAFDWLEAICTGRQAGSNFGYGGPLTQTALLGVIALRFPGQTLQWDDKHMRFTNVKAANEFLRPAFRHGWHL